MRHHPFFSRSFSGLVLVFGLDAVLCFRSFVVTSSGSRVKDSQQRTYFPNRLLSQLILCVASHLIRGISELFCTVMAKYRSQICPLGSDISDGTAEVGALCNLHAIDQDFDLISAVTAATTTVDHCSSLSRSSEYCL